MMLKSQFSEEVFRYAFWKMWHLKLLVWFERVLPIFLAIIAVYMVAPIQQARLGGLKYFMVGCGALGCELLKNFAMMGVASGPEGRIYVTDDDVIEKSNLSRQFLFRNHNVGQSKSQAASRAILGMNPSLKIDARQVKSFLFRRSLAILNRLID
jgi:molybdopterin/thiamine biosynthesis adenylyltransferase